MKVTTILVGGGIAAVLAYKFGYLDQFLAPAADPPASPVTPEPSNPTVPAPNTKALVLEAAGGGNPLYTFDQWNTYYVQVRGNAGPDPGAYLLTTNERSKRLTVDEWWSYMTRAGFSGIIRGRGGESPCNPFVSEPGGGRF